MPVFALFYIASQVDLAQFGIIFSAFALTILVLEIPSGVVADILGRKNTMVVGKSLFIVEIALLAFTNGFWPLLIAKVFSGVGVSLVSGADQSLLYDSLKELKREKEFKKVYGSFWFFNNVIMAIVFIIGSFLFTIDPKLPAIATLPTSILGFLLMFFVIEPTKSTKRMSESYLHLKESITYAYRNKYVKYVILFSMGVAPFCTMLFAFSSVYFEGVSIPVIYIGIVAAIATLTGGITSKRSHVFENIIGEKASFNILMPLLIVALILSGLVIPYWGALIFISFYIIYGFFNVISGDYINKHIPSSHRATINSINNMGKSISRIILYTLFGFIVQYGSMQKGLFTLAIISAVYMVAMLLYASHKKIHSNGN